MVSSVPCSLFERRRQSVESDVLILIFAVRNRFEPIRIDRSYRATPVFEVEVW